MDHSIEPLLFQKLLETYQESTGHELRQLNPVEAGRIVFKENSLPKGVYYIKSGQVKLFREEGGTKQAICRIAQAHEFIGYLSLIRNTPYRVSAETLVDSEIWFIARQVFIKRLKTDLEFVNSFVHVLCDRLQCAENHIHDLKTKDVRQRLATTLLSLSQAYTNGHTFPIVEGLKRKDLAAIIAVTPETLSRQLTAFETEGILRLEDKTITIHNPERLLLISNLQD